MRLIPAFAIFLVLASAGCTYSIHNVHVSDMSPAGDPAIGGGGQLVKAQAEQFVVLWLASDTNYVKEAYRKIQEACRDGEVRGLSTQHSTAHGFFSWTNKILIQGYCFDGAAANKQKSSVKG